MTLVFLRRRLNVFVATVLMLALVLGCGGSNAPLNTVEGKITYKGAEVTGGSILFYPASGGPIPGFIKADGTYIGSEIPLGETTVTIDTASVQNTGKVIVSGKAPSGSDASKYPGGDIQGAAKAIKIPAKYADRNKSGLKFTVGKGKNQKDFELTD